MIDDVDPAVHAVVTSCFSEARSAYCGSGATRVALRERVGVVRKRVDDVDVEQVVVALVCKFDDELIGRVVDDKVERCGLVDGDGKR